MDYVIQTKSGDIVAKGKMDYRELEALAKSLKNTSGSYPISFENIRYAFENMKLDIRPDAYSDTGRLVAVLHVRKVTAN